jgi:hypothetical protein
MSPAKRGSHFTVASHSRDYDIELVSFNPAGFTLRLDFEEVIEPIRPR